MPGRIRYLKIENYRSIREPIRVDFPRNTPVIILGENNAGKSNIIRALDLVLGEYWPGSHSPADHEFWNREPGNGPIRIGLGVENILGREGMPIEHFRWECSSAKEQADFKVVYENGSDSWVNNQIREQLTAVTISADRRLSYQMSYASKWTLLSKLMKKFHGHLTDDASRVARLKQKFEEITGIFREVGEFANFQSEMREQFGEMLAGMSYQLGIDFSAYDPSNYFQSLRVFPSEGDETRTFEELGTGQEQVLAIAFAHAYAKAFYGGIVLIIEEPEAHLHPLAQVWLGRKIHQMTADGLQTVISTHSPAMLDILGLEGFVLVSKNNSVTVTRQLNRTLLVQELTSTGARTDENSVLPYYAWSSTQEILAGFFAKKIVLVEGDTERLALPIYMEKVGLDSAREGIAFIQVLGKGNLAKWWRLFNAFRFPVYVIFDNDPKDDNDGKKRRDILTTIEAGDDLIVEGLLSAEDWLIERSYSIFGKDFEATMGGFFSEYSKLTDEARPLFGRSKPLNARYIAERLTLQEKDNKGIEMLIRLSKAIQNLV